VYVSAHVSAVVEVCNFASDFKCHSKEASWACAENLDPYQPLADTELVNGKLGIYRVSYPPFLFLV
jgi:hypothetical protein